MLHAIHDFLVEKGRRGATADFSAMTVVLPGARAGRRLLELLTLGSEAGVVTPPRILTLGAWVSPGVTTSGVPAGTMARLAAWCAALGAVGADARRAIARLPVAADEEDSASDGMRWLGVARLIDSCHVELSGEGLRFEDIVRRGPLAQDFADADRWLALAAAQAEYEKVLRDAGLVDAGLATLEMLGRVQVERDLLSGAGAVVLAGISEMNSTARRMIDAVAERCVAVIAAPAELAERFDGYGCVIPTAWEGVRVDLADDAVTGADGPEGQAGAALRILERIGGIADGAGVPADQITIGVPDAEVEERLRRFSGRLGNVPVRRAEGSPVSFTRPVKLLLAVADYVERRDFGAMASLVRHPDVERWIGRTLGGTPTAWLGILDEYQAVHLHGRVDGTWLSSDDEERATLEFLHSAMTTLLGSGGEDASLLDSARHEPRRWCSRLWDVIRAVYSGRGDGDRESAPRLDPATREACFVIQTHLAELAALPVPLAKELTLTAGETVRLVVHEAGGDAIPEPGENAAIDLVGWLELAADDAPWVIVTGMNEGSVPSASGIDPLLPEGLRRALGLKDRRGRMARDTLAMLQIARSRPAGDATFIFGKRSAAGDPLAPSRLLLMGDEASLLSRVRQWTGAEAPWQGVGMVLRHGKESAFGTTPRILLRPGEVLKVEEMSVTSFRQYLESPYGFYLRHVLGLDELDDRAVEMDALGFGTLVHDVLLKLGEAEMSKCEDPERIAAFLVSNLESVSSMRFGPDPRAEVWVQLEQAKSRLVAFARIQAEWARKGWRIAKTEWSPGKRKASLMVDGTPMYLRGRIDRIDVNPLTGAWAVLDYKTSSKRPELSDACTRDGEWRDPQLALYRHLAAGLAKELGVTGPPELAWIALPTAANESCIVEAEWSDEQLDEADKAMADVVRRVRRGEFSELGRCPPGTGILGWLCGGLEGEGGE